MEYTIIKTKELPRDVQAVISEYRFSGTQVKVTPVTEFTCPTNWHDANIMTLVVYNSETGEHKAQRSGNYDSYMNFSKEELAMYHGQLSTSVPGPHIWFLLIETYPKQCHVYCHPAALAKAIDKPKLELNKRQEIALYITRSLVSSYREQEARSFGFSKTEWMTVRAELYGLGLMTKIGSLTIEGKNRAHGLNFNTWDYNK